MTVVALPRAPLVHATKERAYCLLGAPGDTESSNGAEVTCYQCKELSRASAMRATSDPSRRLVFGGRLKGKRK